MSKKVAILEGDKSRRFGGVKYLRTDLSGGGTCEWVPESERKLTTKTVKKNGTYNISDEKPDKDGQKYYGFSQFTVNVKNSTTGRKNPSTGGDGNEYSVRPNEDTGMLEETLLPSSIQIITQPSKTTYQNGESISIGGAVVKAYKEDGTIWESEGYSGGVIPNSELTLDPTTASSGSGDSYAEKDGYTVPYCAPSQGYVAFGVNAQAKEDNTYGYAQVSGQSEIYAVCWSGSGGNNAGIELFSLSPFSGTMRTYGRGQGTLESEQVITEDWTYYFARSTGSITTDGAYPNPEWFPEKCSPHMTRDNIAKTLFKGTHHGGGPEQITVKWNRPEDEKELTDTFNITVTSGTGSGGSTGGNTGGNNTGGGGGSW